MLVAWSVIFGCGYEHLILSEHVLVIGGRFHARGSNPVCWVWTYDVGFRVVFSFEEGGDMKDQKLARTVILDGHAHVVDIDGCWVDVSWTSRDGSQNERVMVCDTKGKLAVGVFGVLVYGVTPSHNFYFFANEDYLKRNDLPSEIRDADNYGSYLADRHRYPLGTRWREFTVPFLEKLMKESKGLGDSLAMLDEFYEQAMTEGIRLRDKGLKDD